MTQQRIPGTGPDWREAVQHLGKAEAEAMLVDLVRVVWLEDLGFTLLQDCEDSQKLLKDSKNAVKARLNDFIATEPEDLDALLDSRFAPPPGPVLDCCAGDGAILRRLIERGWSKTDLFACEKREEERDHLTEITSNVIIGDWHQVRKELNTGCPECGGTGGMHGLNNCPCCFSWTLSPNCSRESNWRGWPASTLITNIPYADIPAFPLACLSPDLPGSMRYVALLMPIEEFSGVKRATWLEDNPPTGLLCLKRRPFKNVRGVCWVIWERGKPALDIAWR